MKNTVAIKENHVFRRLYRKGESAVTPSLALYVRRNGMGKNRLGITVSTKLGHAVVRNRVRRRLREIYRLHEGELLAGIDLVVVARVRSAGYDYHQLERDFLRACVKLGLYARQGGESGKTP